MKRRLQKQEVLSAGPLFYEAQAITLIPREDSCPDHNKERVKQNELFRNIITNTTPHEDRIFKKYAGELSKLPAVIRMFREELG